MSDYDRWIRIERASQQLYRLTVAPELWRCHELMDHAERVSLGLPTEGIRWCRGDMPSTVPGIGARMVAAWQKLRHRVAPAAPAAETSELATLQHQ
jgi:hypothetical protein